MLMAHFVVEGAPLTAPPLHADTVLMLATGWDWPTLQATPQCVLEEIMEHHRIENQVRLEQSKGKG